MARHLKQTIPTDLRWAVWERDNYTCHYCGSRRRLTIDHVIPECRGGLTVARNLVTACASCNGHKGSRSYDSFCPNALRTSAYQGLHRRRLAVLVVLTSLAVLWAMIRLSAA